MQNQEVISPSQETAKRLLASLEKSKKKRKLYGGLKLIAGLALAIGGVSLSMSGNAVFYGAVLVGIYWIVVGGIDAVA